MLRVRLIRENAKLKLAQCLKKMADMAGLPAEQESGNGTRSGVGLPTLVATELRARRNQSENTMWVHISCLLFVLEQSGCVLTFLTL